MSVTRNAPPPRGRDAVGVLMAELTRAVVGLHRERIGRGPTQARCTWVDDETVLCVMRDCFTRSERTLLEQGHHEGVRCFRADLARALRPQLASTVETVMGRSVLAVLSQVSTDPEVAIELFLLGPATGGASSE